MKVAIVGSRDIENITEEYIMEYIPENCSEIVSGGARGIDKLAENIAKNKNIKITVFKPNYKLYGKKAPLVRNSEIVDYSDYVLAFWDYKSNGTRHTILECIKKNREVKVIMVD